MSWTPSFDASSLSAVVPTLPKGAYAAYIRSASIEGKESSFFKIQEAQVWDKSEKKFVDVLDASGNKTYTINARILLQVILTSEKAKKILSNDEPFFMRWIDIRFDENFQINPANNQQYRTLLDVLDLTSEDFGQYISFEFDPDVEVPDFLANEPKAVEMINSLSYWKQYFTFACNSIKDQKVKAIIEQTTKQDQTKENILSASRTSCGFLKYQEGCENDYVEN